MLPENEFLEVLEWITDHYNTFNGFPLEYVSKKGFVYDLRSIIDGFYNTTVKEQ
jgi:hypothetical protein